MTEKPELMTDDELLKKLIQLNIAPIDEYETRGIKCGIWPQTISLDPIIIETLVRLFMDYVQRKSTNK